MKPIAILVGTIGAVFLLGALYFMNSTPAPVPAPIPVPPVTTTTPPVVVPPPPVDTPPIIVPPSNSSSADFTIPVGGQYVFKNLTLRPMNIVSDSRCAKGTTCIWAGEVTVDIAIVLSQKQDVYVMKSVTAPTLTVGEYNVSLVGVSPEKTGQTLSPEKYAFHFTIAYHPPLQVHTSISGTLLIGPSCPVMRIDTPCPDQPGQNIRLAITDQSGKLVVEVVTDTEGKFSTSVPTAGTYTIAQSGGVLYPRVEAQTVTVLEGKNTVVALQGDSGIR